MELSCPISLESRNATWILAIQGVTVTSENGGPERIEILTDSNKTPLMEVFFSEIYEGTDVALADLARSKADRSDLIKRIQEAYEIIAITYLGKAAYFLVPKNNHKSRTRVIEKTPAIRHFARRT